MANKLKSYRDSLASRILYDDFTGKEKKLEEGKVLEGFLQRIGFGCLKFTDNESPDFFITLSNERSQKTIACELTSFYNDIFDKRGSKEKRLFEKWKKIARQLRVELDRHGNGLEFVYGVLSFKEPTTHVLDLMDVDVLIDELVKITKMNFNFSSITRFPIEGFPLLSRLLDELRLFVYPETGLLWWLAHLQSGSVNNPELALIKIIENKNLEASSYYWKDIEEKWLIIYAESHGLADLAYISQDPEIAKKIKRIQFTRIYLWNKFFEDITELFPSFRKICDSDANVRNKQYLPKSVQLFITKGREYLNKSITS